MVSVNKMRNELGLCFETRAGRYCRCSKEKSKEEKEVNEQTGGNESWQDHNPKEIPWMNENVLH